MICLFVLWENASGISFHLISSWILYSWNILRIFPIFFILSPYWLHIVFSFLYMVDHILLWYVRRQAFRRSGRSERVWLNIEIFPFQTDQFVRMTVLGVIPPFGIKLFWYHWTVTNMNKEWDWGRKRGTSILWVALQLSGLTRNKA